MDAQSATVANGASGLFLVEHQAIMKVKKSVQRLDGDDVVWPNRRAERKD